MTIQFRLAFIAFLFISTANATIINVPGDQLTIQAGIDSASVGDTVLVQLGTYVENINFNGKNIVVGSLTLTTEDTSYISQTVIDGDRSGSVVTFESGENSTAVLSGFTITNGSGTTMGLVGFGGGVYCYNSSPVLTNVDIKGNGATYGGGIYCSNSNLVLNQVDIKENTAGHGGGILLSDSSPNLAIVTVSGNVAYGHGIGWPGGGISGIGGGIYCDNSSPNLANVTVTRNTASHEGGGIDFNASNPSFDVGNRCNIYLNDADSLSKDLNADTATIAVIVDTFTVMNPTEDHAYPLDKFTFDILHAKAVPAGTYESEALPLEFALHQNHPNPFNPMSTIRYDLPKSSNVSLIIYDILGREVTRLVDRYMEPGHHQTQWIGRDEDGQEVPSGIYIARLITPEYTKSIKMVLLR